MRILPQELIPLGIVQKKTKPDFREEKPDFAATAK